MLVALGAARRAGRHVRGLKGRELLRPGGVELGRAGRGQLLAVLQGRHLLEAGLGRVLEPGFFDWVAGCESPLLADALGAAVAWTQDSEPTAGALARQYLKRSPAGFRRALGEHYTPGWLVDLVLERAHFDSRADSVLDPTCGAGVFLARALSRIRIDGGLRGRDAVRAATRRVRGVELNPLAVSLARLAYLDALGPEGCACLCGDWSVPVTLGDVLFGTDLDETPVDLVAGNPPWLNWERLSPAYREALRTHPGGLAEALFPHRGLRARSGGAHDDLAGLMAYAVADRFLGHGGRLGLVLPVSLLRSRRGGEGFRGLRLGERFQLDVRSVDDLSALKPFSGAAGRTAVLVAQRGTPTRYPVVWNRWPRAGRAPRVDESLQTVRQRARPAALCAEPVSEQEPTSPWLVGTPEELVQLRRLAGPSPYRARKGVDTSLNAVFWVEVLGDSEDLVRIRNAQTRSRVRVEPVEALVEPGALCPVLRGRDFNRWFAAPRYHQVLLYDPATGRPLSEDVARERFPRAWAYLQGYTPLLTRRRIYEKHLQGQPPYACYDIGPYSFAPIKVVWKALADGIRACVVTTVSGVPVVPDHNVVLVPMTDLSEAHFLCGMLNASQTTRFADAYTGWFYSTHLLQTFKVPQYNSGSGDHRRIAALSSRAHREPIEATTLQAHLDDLVARLDDTEELE